MSKRLTTTEFVERSYQMHGDAYEYQRTVYKDSTSKVTITCPVHGDFDQMPFSHLDGAGCYACSYVDRGIKRRITVTEFISRANAIHGGKYKYDLVDYTNSQTKVTIICPIHGPFDQQPNNHLESNGCPACSIIQSSSVKSYVAAQEFIEKARLCHGDRYDYSISNYKTAKTKVDIVCRIHGVFRITPDSHLQGKGCSLCNKVGRYSETYFANYPDEGGTPALAYVLEFTSDEERFIKVGITSRSIEARYSDKQYEPFVIRPIYSITGPLVEVFRLEQDLKNALHLSKVIPSGKFEGHTECFKPEALLDICEFVDDYNDPTAGIVE